MTDNGGPQDMADVMRQLAAAALPYIVALAVMVAGLIVVTRLAAHMMRTAPPSTIRARAWHLLDDDDDRADDLEPLPPWDAEREEALQEAWAELAPYEWPTDHG